VAKNMDQRRTLAKLLRQLANTIEQSPPSTVESLLSEAAVLSIVDRNSQNTGKRESLHAGHQEYLRNVVDQLRGANSRAAAL
jgi:hypothetical protein